MTEKTETGSTKCLRCLHEWWPPSPDRIAEYEAKLKECNHIMDFVSFRNMYKDVVEHLEKSHPAKP